MFFQGCSVLILPLLCLCHIVYDAASVNRGAQARLTSKGMLYGASIGVKKLEQELKNKVIPSQSGSTGDVSYRAQNIIINYLKVGRYHVEPVAGVGLRLSVNDVFVSAQGRVSFQYRKGWIKIGDTTNVKIKGSRVGFSVVARIDAKDGRPSLQVTGCSSSIGDVDLDFSGGLSWIYNLFSSLLEKKLGGVLKNLMCGEGTKLIGKELNQFLTKFPVRQNIENWAIIDYSFEKPVVGQDYIDLMLRGEFLDVKNTVRSSIPPPRLDTIASSGKMAYVWISDFTLNSAGKVFHEAGLLKKHLSPLITKELIPAGVKPFLNTRSFEQIIPELFQRYPDRPIQFDLQTIRPPKFDIDSNKIDVLLFVKATIGVIHKDQTSTPIFYIDINVNASGSVKISKPNHQLLVGGNIVSFSFTASVGGSVIGEISIPFDNKSIKDLVHGLVIDQANPILNKGFPIPKIKDLDFENPAVTMVKDAIRVDTNIVYSG